MFIQDNNPDPSEAALKVMEDLLSYLDMDGQIVVGDATFMTDDDNETIRPLILEINGEDMGILIGRRGQTLAAVQYILRLIVAQKQGVSFPIVLDVNGYKQRRYESLQTLAQHVAEQVAVSRRSVALEPMPAYERRIIHLALADHQSVITQSTGFGEARKVVVIPRETVLR